MFFLPICDGSYDVNSYYDVIVSSRTINLVDVIYVIQNTLLARRANELVQCRDMYYSHDNVSKDLEQFALQRFGHEVC